MPRRLRTLLTAQLIEIIIHLSTLLLKQRHQSILDIELVLSKYPSGDVSVPKDNGAVEEVVPILLTADEDDCAGAAGFMQATVDFWDG